MNYVKDEEYPERLKVRFLRGIKINSQTGCWEWQKFRNRKNYGCMGIRLKGRSTVRMTHRIAWMIYKGEIPEGLQVCHHCDNPPCCNPDHLFIGTNRDNVLDCQRKGRANTLYGAKHGMSKLKDQDIIVICQLYALGFRQPVIATHFGIDQTNVSMIVQGKTWKHMHEPVEAN